MTEIGAIFLAQIRGSVTGSEGGGAALKNTRYSLQCLPNESSVLIAPDPEYCRDAAVAQIPLGEGMEKKQYCYAAFTYCTINDAVIP